VVVILTCSALNVLLDVSYNELRFLKQILLKLGVFNVLELLLNLYALMTLKANLEPNPTIL
jgi:hypothetical protein